MSKAWIRTQMLIGEDALTRLEKASVAIFGVGGVGGYAAEALARTGIGRIVLIDHDVVSESNRNRQLIALTDTVGRPKVDVWKERIAARAPLDRSSLCLAMERSQWCSTIVPRIVCICATR